MGCVTGRLSRSRWRRQRKGGGGREEGRARGRRGGRSEAGWKGVVGGRGAGRGGSGGIEEALELMGWSERIRHGENERVVVSFATDRETKVGPPPRSPTSRLSLAFEYGRASRPLLSKHARHDSQQHFQPAEATERKCAHRFLPLFLPVFLISVPLPADHTRPRLPVYRDCSPPFFLLLARDTLSNSTSPRRRCFRHFPPVNSTK